MQSNMKLICLTNDNKTPESYQEMGFNNLKFNSSYPIQEFYNLIFYTWDKILNAIIKLKCPMVFIMSFS